MDAKQYVMTTISIFKYIKYKGITLQVGLSLLVFLSKNTKRTQTNRSIPNAKHKKLTLQTPNTIAPKHFNKSIKVIYI